jgi:hypothetical protein
MSVWERAPEVVWRRSGRRRILMGASSEDVLVVEGAGGPIWDALERPVSEDDLVAELSGRFGVQTDDVRAQVTSFLAELQSLGLVKPR